MTKSLPRKRRRQSVISFEMVRLERAAPEPLHLQLYRQIRDQITSGTFIKGASRLPSSRALAADLAISRLTVNLAFSKLHAEGYLRTKKGSGTFIADPLPETFLRVEGRHGESIAPALNLRLANRVTAIPDPRVGAEFDLGAPGVAPGVIFIPGVSALDEFPIATWEKLRAKVLAQKGSLLLRYASHRGDAELRKALAVYLGDFRGARCHPDQIIITAGIQQAILMTTMALVNEGEIAWMEDPGFHQARRTFAFAGARVIPKTVDAEGLVIAGEPGQPDPKIVYITPSHQFPLGVTMSLRRRQALIDFARSTGAFILEDDYDSEFRFDGPPLPCLQGLDSSGRVIYAGTMSKILFPSLRLGYLVVPEQLLEPMMKIRAVMDQHSPAIDQATLARFITEGFFLSHIKRMRKLYAERRTFFTAEFQRLLGDRFILKDTQAGLHFVAWLRRKEDFAPIRRLRAEIAVGPSSLSFFCIEAELAPAYVFGFSAWTHTQISEGLMKIASALKAKDVAHHAPPASLPRRGARPQLSLSSAGRP